MNSPSTHMTEMPVIETLKIFVDTMRISGVNYKEEVSRELEREDYRDLSCEDFLELLAHTNEDTKIVNVLFEKKLSLRRWCSTSWNANDLRSSSVKMLQEHTAKTQNFSTNWSPVCIR